MKKNSVKVKKSIPRGLEDERFNHLKSDPKYNGLSNVDKKIVIEKRFASALTDSKFSSRAPVDKRGRLTKRTTGNELSELYELEKSDEEEVPSKKPKKVESSGEETDNEDPIKIDLARGEGNLSSSDDSDSDESDLDIQNDFQIDADIAQLDHDAEQVEWASRRLAACNLDWQVTKAEDIMILVNSFKPQGGRVERISIYLSDFGKERLEEEDKQGPRLDITKPLDESDEIHPDTKAAIRKYQIDLLKYYYAVIECDSEKTATAIYEQCDGFNFEGSGLKMDLRFIPDDMEFEEDRLRETMTEADINLEKYKPKVIFDSGLLGTAGKLSWDENDTDRKLRMQDAFIKDENAIAGLIAESDSDDEETTQNRMEALKSLLGDEKEVDAFHIDWSEAQNEEKGTEEAAEDSDSDIEKALAKRDNQVYSSDEEEKDATKETVQQKKKTNYKTYLEKKKQKKREKKQQIKNSKEGERRSINVDVDQKKQKGKKIVKQTEETAEKVVSDDRFKALFTDSAFAIEQSSKEYKGSKLIEKQAALKKENKSKQNTGDDTLSRLKQKASQWEQKKKRKN